MQREDERAALAARGHSYQSYDPLSTEAKQSFGAPQKVIIPAIARGTARKGGAYSLPTVHYALGKALGGYSTIGGDDENDRSHGGDIKNNLAGRLSLENRGMRLSLALSLLCIGVWAVASIRGGPAAAEPARLHGAWSSLAEPFSKVDPRVSTYMSPIHISIHPYITQDLHHLLSSAQTLGLLPADRPKLSRPGPIFGDIREGAFAATTTNIIVITNQPTNQLTIYLPRRHPSANKQLVPESVPRNPHYNREQPRVPAAIHHRPRWSRARNAHACSTRAGQRQERDDDLRAGQRPHSRSG